MSIFFLSLPVVCRCNILGLECFPRRLILVLYYKPDLRHPNVVAEAAGIMLGLADRL